MQDGQGPYHPLLVTRMRERRNHRFAMSCVRLVAAVLLFGAAAVGLAAAVHRKFFPTESSTEILGPVSFDVDASQVSNARATKGRLVAPKKYFFGPNGKEIGSIQYARMDKLNNGNSKFAVAFLTAHSGANRDIHMHTSANEWAFVINGPWLVSLIAPTRRNSTPWNRTRGVVRKNGAWFFPKGWWHSLTCVAEDEQACVAVIFFDPRRASIYPAPNSPQLSQMIHVMPLEVVAHVLGTSLDRALEVKENISGSSKSQVGVPYLSVSEICPSSVCNASCLEKYSRKATPSVIAEYKVDGKARSFEYLPQGLDCDYPGSIGAFAWDLSASRGMSSLALDNCSGISAQLVE